MKNSLPRIFRFWRLGILIIAQFALFFVTRQTDFNFIKQQFRLSDLLTMWSNFDGVHYINIAKYGYEAGSTHYTEAFFPIYPFVIKIFSLILRNYTLAGLVVSNISLYLAFIYLVKLIKLDFSQKFAFEIIFLILIFPTSFYLGSVYSESLYFLLSVLCFYSARKKCWTSAALLAAVASATRLVGIFLFPALIIEYFLSHDRKISAFFTPKAFILMLAPLGLLFYMTFLYFRLHDPLYFVHVQPIFNASRQVNKIVPLPQVFFRYLKIAITVNPFTYAYFVAMMELIVSSLFFVLIIFSFKLRFSYGFYALFSFLLPTFTGTFSSLPRYVIVLFPGFIILNQFLQNSSRTIRYIYYLLSLCTLIYSVAAYTSGYFVS